ncbi:hypothetical protein [Streptomyces sp. NPDC054838]
MTTPTPPKPGGTPTVTAVIKFLKAAGFQHSRFTDARSKPTSSGFYVRESGRPGEVDVRWREGDHDYFQRMDALGLTDVADVPTSPHGEQIARQYAEALAPRYNVQVSGGSVYVTARAELPARPKGVPRATLVRKALEHAGITDYRAATVVDQPDHTRIAVADDIHLESVTDTLHAQGWIFEQSETHQHYALKITGSTPDRRARASKQRAQQTRQAQPEPAREQPQAPATEPVQAPDSPQAVPAPPQPMARAHSRTGTPYTPGARVTYRTRDGFWRHGTVTELFNDPETGQPKLRFTEDAYQAAPARRTPQGMDNHPGKLRPAAGDKTWAVAVDDKDLGPDRRTT